MAASDPAPTIIVAALIIISVLGVATYYDAQGNLLVGNETVNITVDNTTRILDQSATYFVYSDTGVPVRDICISTSIPMSNAVIDSLRMLKFPYSVSVNGTELYVGYGWCNERLQFCEYWLSATRNGEEVQTNSPVWVTVSQGADLTGNENFSIIEGDLKVAFDEMLVRYVNGQPVGRQRNKPAGMYISRFINGSWIPMKRISVSD